MNTRNEKVGFIGLGLMGKPMCLNLHRAGIELVAYNRSQPARDQLAAQGVNTTDVLNDLTHQCSVLIIMVADTNAVEHVLLSEQGVVQGLQAGTLVIDMGTTAALKTREFAKIVSDHNCEYLDAPVSGGMIGAEQASLAIMAGGSDVAFARARPLLEILGQNVTHVGGVSAGQVAKAANQVIVGLTIGAVAEALALAKHAGVDPAKVRAALRGGFADSRIMELHGQRMIEGKFAPGGKVVTQRKDMFQALQLAEAFDLELPATKLNMDLYDQLIAQGGGDLDHSALYKVIDK